MRPRWCVRCKQYIAAWLVVTVGGRKTRRCGRCGWVTRARKPRAPKHQAADRKRTQAVKVRAGGQCEVCGRVGSDGAHVRSKGAHPELRGHPKNLLYFCRQDHDHFTRHPEQFRAWLAIHHPGLLEELTEAAR